MMALSINNLAKNYGLLPSEVLLRADTFDLHVLDLATRWEIRQNQKARGEKPQDNRKMPTQEEMMAMIKRVKERKDGQG